MFNETEYGGGAIGDVIIRLLLNNDLAEKGTMALIIFTLPQIKAIEQEKLRRLLHTTRK